MANNAATTVSPQIPDSQLLIVSGKGGVGKTAVATAIARAYAGRGHRTLLTVYEREDCDHPLLGERVGYEPEQIDSGLWLSRLDSRLSMKEYIHRNIPFHLLYDWLLSSKMLGQFTDAAPGFDELMCLGKLFDLAEGSGGKQQFDHIVFDAPATGHSALMLRTPGVTAEAVRSGPIHDSALKVEAMLEDPQRCSVLVVALAEEMAIQEGCELLRYVSGELGFSTGPMIVNRTRPARFSDSEIQQLLGQRDKASSQARAVIDNAAAHHQLHLLQRAYMQDLRQQWPAILEVPHIVGKQFNAANIVAGIGAALQPGLGAMSP